MCLLLAASVLGSKLDLSPWLRAPRQLAGAGDTGGVAALGLVTALQQWAEQLETEGSTVGIYLHQCPQFSIIAIHTSYMK